MMKHNTTKLLSILLFAASVAACAEGESGSANIEIDALDALADGSETTTPTDVDDETDADATTPDDTEVDTDTEPHPDAMTDATVDADTVTPPDMGPDATDMTDMGTEPDIVSETPCTLNSDCVTGQFCNADLTCGEPKGTGDLASACSVGSDCKTGLCSDGLCTQLCEMDNDCPAALDCSPRTLPAEGGDAELSVCTPKPRSCQTDTDCPTGQSCTADRSGTEVVLTCSPEQGAATGESCSADADCDSGLCIDSVCAGLCERPADCGAQMTCVATTVETGSGAMIEQTICESLPPEGCIRPTDCSTGTCTADHTTGGLTCETPVGAGSYGDACTADADCESNLCLGNICTIACGSDVDCKAQDFFRCQNADFGQNTFSVCTPPEPCATTAECGSGDVCGLTPTANDIRLLCADPKPGGSLAGTVCQSDATCRSGLCVDGRFDDICSALCQTDADCPQSMECGVVQRNDQGGSPHDINACVPKPETGCTDSADCSPGQVCAAVTNQAGTGLEKACVIATGTSTGQPCSSNSQCASRICMRNVCTPLCDAAAGGPECGGSQICRTKPVTEGANTTDFDVCLQLGDVQCTKTSDCQAADADDDVRVCGDIRNESGTYNAYCVMPNTGQAAVGASCSDDAGCASTLCLSGTTNECSEVCETDAHCGAGGACVSFRFGQNSNPVKMCTTGCESNTECSNGNVCSIAADVDNDTFDFFCAEPEGPGRTGAVCTDDADCESGVCLTGDFFNGTSCNDSSQCASGDRCLCKNPPTCDQGECGGPAAFCSSLCRVGQAGTDCSGVSGNTLTQCGDVNFTRPSQNGTEAVKMCVQ